MKRTVISTFLALAALAMLAALVWRSRSLPLDVHIAQNVIGTTLERSSEDFGTLVTTLQSAWDQGQAPGTGAATLEERLAGSPDRLRALVAEIPGAVTQRSLVQNSFQAFSQTIKSATALATRILGEQTHYIDNVDAVRNQGPKLIQQMRDNGLGKQAASVFQLVIGTLDFATPSTTADAGTLHKLLTTFEQDPDLKAKLPNQASAFATAVQSVLESKPGLESQLTQLARMPVVNQASNLHYAAQALYRNAVASHDQARTMLAIYAIALLLVVGFIALRLQGSYREINRTNADLAELNASLEGRVAARTNELSGALKNLQASQVQLVQAEKMSSLGQLVAGISHEINTPLLYLSNNATLIQERLTLMQRVVAECAETFALSPEAFADRTEFQQRLADGLKRIKHTLKHEEVEANLEEAVDLVNDSVDGLADLTQMAQSLKDFSRLDRSPVAEFDVHAGLDKTLVIARNIVKHKAEIQKHYGKISAIECSPSQVNQVFLNLITNAAQAIPDFGEITLTTTQPDAHHIAVSISDNGTGIAPEILDKIRDPFFTTKEVGSGTGLGLSICDEIIRGHGGELKIESKQGEGSTFTVLLPIKHVEAQKAEPPTEDAIDIPALGQDRELLAAAS